MKSFVVRELLTPLATRLGTFFAALLIGSIGADPVLADEFGVGLTALALVAIDLATSFYTRRKAAKALVAKGEI